ncbi:hypothetical protein BDV06DRAFT_194609 [Aspergillus oleicola]
MHRNQTWRAFPTSFSALCFQATRLNGSDKARSIAPRSPRARGILGLLYRDKPTSKLIHFFSDSVYIEKGASISVVVFFSTMASSALLAGLMDRATSVAGASLDGFAH